MRVHVWWRSRKGTSLVEILVVMVVLLIGIMTVIQMFPTGFRVVRTAESQTIATRLAQQELERWKSMSANLPVGILPIDDRTDIAWNDQKPAPPFEAFLKEPNGDWTKVGNRYARGNALNVRQIIGESTLIPVASYFRTGAGAQYGAKYTLAFSPIDVVDVGGKIEGIWIKSGDLRRRLGNYEDAPPALRPGDYAVDYELVDGQGGEQVFHVAFPTSRGMPPRVYYVSYSFWASENPANTDLEWELYSKIDQPVDLLADPTGSHGDWVEVPVLDVPSGYTLMEVERYSETCARGFREHRPGTPGHQDKPWCDYDPYEYILADSIMGVVAFNPSGRGRYEYTARGIRPIEARIDYRIYDLRIIREDRVVPEPQANATTIPVKLSLRFILNIGDPTDNPGEEDGYPGLIKDPGAGMSILMPVLVMDLATGLRVSLPGGPNEIDFKAGVVNLPIRADLVDFPGAVLAANEPLAGRHLRFYYRADGDWSVQCQKAYATYTRKWGATDPDYRSYKVKGSNKFPDRLSNRLLFAACEGLKTVVVDYSYVTIAPDGNRVEHKTAGEQHMIDLPTDASGDTWCIDLNVPAGGFLPRDGRLVVVGSSFTVRVIWRDGKNWRHVDMDTSLVKS